MSQATTLILLPETVYTDPGGGATYTVTGDQQPAAAYYLGNRDLQTVNYSTNSFTGDLVLQATLSSDPGNDDWFTIHEFNGSTSDEVAFSNLTGNFVYIRAMIYEFGAGTILYVKLSY
tara:strand:- start:2941 stop:3294 length:354 start_codon:yes stop_codon:yes gene_type:complete